MPGKVKTSGPHRPESPLPVRPLTLEDAKALRRLPHITGMSAVVWGNTEVKGNGRLRRTTVEGVTPDMLKSTRHEDRQRAVSAAGRNRERTQLCCAGSKLKSELFGVDNALGERLTVGNPQFRVVGVLESKGQFLGIDLDDAAYIPTARALELYNRDGMMTIDPSYEEGIPAARISASIISLLKARHGREDFSITTQEDMLKTLVQWPRHPDHGGLAHWAAFHCWSAESTSSPS
ncbi:ABC transporter permease [Propionivibrio sp.]|uniref:ABC transporter permease n=1 Tax=Propionivibrio sp. TaxID=2212460 RepID=UPI0025D8A0F4|nr:ABC transporter permease [Propionivibrio sp.]